MALTVIDLPDDVARAVEISWTMDTAHGRSVSPFTGQGYAVRGNLERWKFVAKFKPLTREDFANIQSFFLQLEGNLHSFRMADPSQNRPLGRVTGSPVLDGNHSARDRVLSLRGVPGNVARWLAAGDWVQVGSQLTKVVSDVSTTSAGKATVSIWPFLWSDYPDGQSVEVRTPKGVFHFEEGPPSWTVSVANKIKPFSFQLHGAQTIPVE